MHACEYPHVPSFPEVPIEPPPLNDWDVPVWERRRDPQDEFDDDIPWPRDDDADEREYEHAVY